MSLFVRSCHTGKTNSAVNETPHGARRTLQIAWLRCGATIPVPVQYRQDSAALIAAALHHHNAAVCAPVRGCSTGAHATAVRWRGSVGAAARCQRVCRVGGVPQQSARKHQAAVAAASATSTPTPRACAQGAAQMRGHRHAAGLPGPADVTVIICVKMMMIRVSPAPLEAVLQRDFAAQNQSIPPVISQPQSRTR